MRLFFSVDVILLVFAVILSVVKFSVVNGNIVVDVVIFLVDVAGFSAVDVNCSVVHGSYVVDVIVVSVTCCWFFIR